MTKKIKAHRLKKGKMYAIACTEYHVSMVSRNIFHHLVDGIHPPTKPEKFLAALAGILKAGDKFLMLEWHGKFARILFGEKTGYVLVENLLFRPIR